MSEKCENWVPEDLGDELRAISFSAQEEKALARLAADSGKERSHVLKYAILFFLKCESYREHGYQAGVFQEHSDGTVRLISIV